jgi:hypothetical protein
MDFLDQFNPFSWNQTEPKKKSYTAFDPGPDDNLESVHKRNLGYVDTEENTVSAGVVNPDDRKRAIDYLNESTARHQELIQQREAALTDLYLSQQENPGSRSPDRPGFWDKIQYGFTGNPKHLYDSKANKLWYEDKEQFDRNQEKLVREMEILHKYGNAIDDDYARDIDNASQQLTRAEGLDITRENAADKIEVERARLDLSYEIEDRTARDATARLEIERERLDTYKRNVANQIKNRNATQSRLEAGKVQTPSERLSEERLRSQYVVDSLNELGRDYTGVTGLFTDKGEPVNSRDGSTPLSARERQLQSQIYKLAQEKAEARMRKEMGPRNPSLMPGAVPTSVDANISPLGVPEEKKDPSEDWGGGIS